jgi:hypothetical protein
MTAVLPVVSSDCLPRARPLAITRLDGVFDICPSLPHALSSLGGGPDG